MRKNHLTNAIARRKDITQATTLEALHYFQVRHQKMTSQCQDDISVRECNAIIDTTLPTTQAPKELIMAFTSKSGSTSWHTISVTAVPARMPSAFAKNFASAWVEAGMVARQVTSPEYGCRWQYRGVDTCRMQYWAVWFPKLWAIRSRCGHQACSGNPRCLVFPLNWLPH